VIKSFFKDSSIYLIPTVVMYGVNFFLLPIYTRILTPADYGVIDLLRVYESIALLFVALEIGQGLGRHFMDESDPGLRKSYFSTAFIFTVICFSLFFGISMIFSQELSKLIIGIESSVTNFKLGVTFISLNGILLISNTQFRYELRSKEYVIVSLVTFLSISSFSIIFAYLLQWRLSGMLLAIVLGNLSGLLTAVWLLRESISLDFNLRLLKKMLIFSAPLVPSGMAIFVSGYIDRIMIKNFLSLNEVGLYGMGFRVSAIVSLLLVGFNRALSPLIISNYRKSETPADIAKIFRWFVGLGLLFFMGLSLFAGEILYLFTTPQYYDAKNIVIFLVPAILFSQMYMFTPGAGITKKTHYTMWISFFSAILNTTLNYFMIPKLGYSGAALATLLSHGIIFIIKVNVSQLLYRIPYEWRKILLAVAGVTVLTIYGVRFDALNYFDIFVKIGILCLLPFLFVVTRIVRPDEVSYVYAKLMRAISKHNN
jgi:O-antigen/teichoic acid export membrane protein